MSSPKEKAEALVNKFLNEVKDSNSRDGGTLMFDIEAKQCALICVDEIIYYLEIVLGVDKEDFEYWQQVKTEIEKL